MKLRLFLILFLFYPLSSFADKPLNVGVLLCLTGNCADWGTAASRGAQLATEEINNQGGILGRKIALIAEDSNEAISGAHAIKGYKKLTEIDKVQFIIGPSWAPGAQALLPLVKKSQEVIVITPSASFKEFPRSAAHIFNFRAAEDLNSAALAKYAIKQGWQTAAIFSSEQPAEMENGRIFQTEFTQLGGTITELLEPSPTVTDLRTLATKIVASKPAVVFLISYINMAEAARQLRSLNYQGPILTISIDQARIDAANGMLDGLIVANFPSASAEFTTAFKHKFNESPGLSAQGGYDAIYAIAKAATSINTFDLQELSKAILKLEYAGASGKIKFDQYGQLIQEPVFSQVIGNQLTALKIK